MTQQEYFSSTERAEALAMAKSLLSTYRSAITHDDIRAVATMIRRGVECGLWQRDARDINPVVRYLRTAHLLTTLIAPDRSMVIATLLFDLCRRDAAMQSEVTARFGPDIVNLIGGLTRVSQLYSKQAAADDENYQKLLLTFADDVRVIIIMIVDRLGLMRLLNGHADGDFVRSVAHEARYLYAPLAHRLGLYQIKSELEDLSLKYLNRKVYTQIARTLNQTKEARDKYVHDFIVPVREALLKQGLKFDIKGRTKSINSIWNKMKKQGVDLSRVYDLSAIRIIIDTPRELEKRDCWVAYSVVTNMYTANPDRMRDWVSVPKSNGYESLHATVLGPGDHWVEVQIRTRRMDEVAERGLAAHWRYKGIKSEQNLDAWMTGVREVLEAGSEGQMELIRNMKMDVYDKDVFVFTPKGEVRQLPRGATVLDFAFSIHTRVGSTCVGARIDGKNQRINYKLQNGDTVEVLTSSTQTPRLDWLNIAVTSRARNKIKLAINEARARQADMARELLQRRFKNRKIALDESVMMRLVKRLGYKTLTDFLVDIHTEHLDVADVMEQYEQLLRHDAEAAQVPQIGAEDFVLHTAAQHDTVNDVLIVGNDVKGINYKLSRCCNPILGDRIIGFVASDGAIKIHRVGCGNVKHLTERYPYRVIKARWSGKIGSQFAATLRVVGRDDIGIVANITSLINKTDSAVLRSISISSNDGEFEGHLVVSVPTLTMLDELVAKILTLKGVRHVARE